MKDDFIHIENTEMVFRGRQGSFHALKNINLHVTRGEFVTFISNPSARSMP